MKKRISMIDEHTQKEEILARIDEMLQLINVKTDK
jgi:hypothetical protein